MQLERRIATLLLGAEPMPMTPEAFDAYMRSALAALAPIMKATAVTSNPR